MVAGSENRKIAKNTIFLYFRMMLIMAVSLYTSRVTLQVLGVDDFGIYQTVGGVVTFLAFISNALGSGSSRFITFEMGKEKPRLDILFSTVRMAHIILAIGIFVSGEIIGRLFIQYKLVIQPERLAAATFAFHFSMLTTFFQITQVPYNAIIIAYERMNVYAYVSIAEAVLKLSIVYLLKLVSYDKLQVYSVLYGIVTVLVMLFYRIYCRKNFEEVKAKLGFNKQMFRSVAAFSSWNLLTSSAASFANQGVTIVTSMFFSPSVITVRSLALRVNSIVNQFIGNFRTAVNPQVVKRYAAKDYAGAEKLALSSTKCTYYLMLLIVLPLYLLVEPILKVWLGEVPEGLISFVKLALIQGLFQAFDTSLYVPIYAKGQMKQNAIISSIFDFIQLPIVYLLFKSGCPPITLAWVEMFACVALGIIVKPFLVHYIVNYNLSELIYMIIQCIIITIFASVVPIVVFQNVNTNTILGFFTVLITCFGSIAVFVWFWGIDKKMRNMMIQWMKSKYRKLRT